MSEATRGLSEDAVRRRNAARSGPDVPDEDDDDKSLASQVRDIEILARRLVNDAMAGQYHAVFKGRGMSFDSVREYAPGDDVRSIDWNVTARTGEVFVKQFVEERELTVLLAVDLSGSQDFGTERKSKRKLVAEIAAVLALSAISNNDRVGLILFTDRIERYIPPKKGRGHVLRVIQELLRFEPEGQGTRIDLACDYLSRIQRRRAVVFLLSDFLGPEYGRALGVAARRHDLVPIVTTDQAEQSWPRFFPLLTLEDAESAELLALDVGLGRNPQIYGERAHVARQRRSDEFRKNGLEPIEAMASRDYLKDLVAYFRRRAARP
jgi:uncharacterized protein (DUF58 family)